MIIKNHSHWQNLLKFNQKQFKNDSIQLKLNIIINQIKDYLAADFYKLMAVWQQIRIQNNIWMT